MNNNELAKYVLGLEGETVIFPKDGDYAVKHADGTVNMYYELPSSQRGCQLIELLCKLTELGKATWLRRKADTGWLYCFIEYEQIIIDFSYTEADFDLESIELDTSFAVLYRGDTFLYLAGLMNGDKLIRLIKSLDIPIDDKKVLEHNEKWQGHLLNDLIEIAK
ncbi:MAG: hypothetical protein WCD18_05940 [Thermosynechococcaceae cyanobacterium]